MPASKRKRLRLERQSTAAESKKPLGTDAPLSGDLNSGKDDEERRLESLLFGKPFVSAPDAKGKGPSISEEAGPSGLEHLKDEDLFFIDDVEFTHDDAVPENVGEISSDAETSSNARNGARSPSPLAVSSSSKLASLGSRTNKKPAAWNDPADAKITVSLAKDNRLRKLREAPSEDQVNGKVYENKLRQQYEKTNPVPEWAVNARAKLQKRPKRRRSSSSTGSNSENDGEYEEEGLTDLLQSTGGIISSSSRSSRLPSGTLAIERLRDANMAGPSEGPISTVRFHPSPSVPVLLTSGSDRRLRLFNVDGLTNPILQTLHIPDLPPSTALFHPSGSSVLITGSRPFYYTYDLQSGRAQRSPRGLWQGASGGDEGSDRSLEISKFSPDGRYVAVGGRRGYVHLMDWASGSGQVVGSVKMHSGVKDICWVGSDDGSRKELLTLGQDAQVYLWDVGSRRCVSRWTDDSAFGPNCLEGSTRGEHYAIGSTTGIVNVYGADAASLPPNDAVPGAITRKPLKTITNLTTSITSLRFDPSGQLMAIGSRAKKDQLRMIHLPSLTTFANWPTSGTPLGTVTSVDFSAGSEYVAIGNTRGKVMLYHLRHFASS